MSARVRTRKGIVPNGRGISIQIVIIASSIVFAAKFRCCPTVDPQRIVSAGRRAVHQRAVIGIAKVELKTGTKNGWQ